MKFSQPSSTITAAFIAGQVVVTVWLLIDQFSSIVVNPALVAETATLAAAYVGYRKRERVLPVGNVNSSR